MAVKSRKEDSETGVGWIKLCGRYPRWWEAGKARDQQLSEMEEWVMKQQRYAHTHTQRVLAWIIQQIDKKHLQELVQGGESEPWEEEEEEEG